MIRKLARKFMNTWIMKPARQVMTKNLGNPGDHYLGRVYLKKWFERNNAFVEELAVSRCNIQPSDKVLELGFGPGLGLQETAKLIASSEGGMVYGVDRSETMVKAATERLTPEINTGLVELHLCSVDDMPFDTHFIDKIFHCNCYYHWPDRQKYCKEILRVLKPGGLMVTTLAAFNYQFSVGNGFFRHEQVHHEVYMADLRKAGFLDVQLEEINKDSQKIYWAIQASAPQSSA